MFLKDCKLGETILVYLDDEGYLSSDITNRMIPAVIFGRDGRGNYLLGWRETGEILPENASRRTPGQRATTVDYDDIESECCFKAFTEDNGSWRVMKDVSINKKTSSEVNMDIELQWRLFRNNQPGQCPCGTNISVCVYHK
jgi:hypothetical protein